MRRFTALILGILLGLSTLETGELKAQHLPAAKEEELFTEGMRLYLKEDYEEALMVWEQLQQKQGQKASTAFYMAKAHLYLGRKEKAKEWAQKAHLALPNSLDIGLFYADLLMAEKEYDKAIACLNAMSPYDEGNPEINLRLAQTYLYQENGQLALEALKKADAYLGEDPEVLRTKQFIYMKLGKYAELLAETHRFLEQYPEELPLAWEAVDLCKFNEWPKAKADLERFQNLHPDQQQIKILLAKWYLEQDSLDTAIAQTQGLEQDSNIPTDVLGQVLLNLLGRVKNQTQSQAIQNHLQGYLKQYPQAQSLWMLEGDLNLNNNQFKESRSAYLKALRLGAAAHKVWERVIQLDLELNQVDSALLHVDEALLSFPNQASLWYQQGFALYLKGRPQESIAALESGLGLIDVNHPLFFQSHALLGDVYQSAKRYPESVKSYELVLEKFPDDEHVLNNYSYYLSLRKEGLERALGMSGQLVQKFPENSTYLDTHGWVLRQMGKYQEALNFIEKALKFGKDQSAEVLDHYGDVLFLLNRKSEALETWKKASQRPGASPQILKKIQMKMVLEN